MLKLAIIVGLISFVFNLYILSDWAYSEYVNSDKVVLFLNSESYLGVKVPSDVNVEIVANVEDLDPGLFKNDWKTRGLYSRLTKKIQVIDGASANTFRHEIAHHYWYYNLTSWQKEVVEDYYDRYCQNPNEFFAYNVGNGHEMVSEIERIYSSFE